MPKAIPTLLIVFIQLVVSCHNAKGVDFEPDIASVLASRCLECHGRHEPSGGLDLTNQNGFLRGGDSGEVFASEDWESSRILKRIRAGEMPPNKQGKSQRLPNSEIEAIEGWLRQGANWPTGRVLDLYERTTEARGGRDWWSFQPIAKPTPRAVKLRDGQALAQVDTFIQQKLQEAGIEPAPVADRGTLIRRVSFDLVGLPPSAEEVERFANDESPKAYEDLVDRLLASPRYGERQARLWLDVARYADTCGYERDQEKPMAWRYRDWVIDAFNRDLPYNEFLTKQLAGDQLEPKTEENVVATGFLRLGTWNDEPNDQEEYKYERLEDLVNVTGAAFLGLTVKCARCHDHKFDPIPQVDYYKIAGAFWPGPIDPRERELLGGPSAKELGFDVLGWTDIRLDPPPLNLFKKGDPQHPLFAVKPGVLSVTKALDRSLESQGRAGKSTGLRKGLADWLVDPSHPLTARVWVNRLWAWRFGKGIVGSVNNFGFKGDTPTHPELLDWLATELVQGGWKSKPIIKMIVMSQAYRQASVRSDTESCENADANNQLLWRYERKRLDAESLRDRLLSASGELDLRQGGPSFKPDIPSEALEGLSRKSQAWQPSAKKEQLRRSVYMFAQRSLAPPLMTTFDLCDTTESCGKRDVSIVAPQALALLNNDFIHDRSRAIANRVAGATTDRSMQIIAAWRFALGRSPTSAEFVHSERHLDRQRARFAEQEAPVSTEEIARAVVSEMKLDGTDADRITATLRERFGNVLHRPKIDADKLALESLCHVLINTNEFIFVD